ncbi:hypothetical protein F4809DRAFT_648564 [Biscogniauxia mediterranea]|nr:hypothetical protein F4809DRAFT_648564 [Biscogniauxia mediterranea]
MVHFPGAQYRTHTTCVTEDQKYQGALYKPKRQKHNQTTTTAQSHTMAHNAYVEDVTENYEAWREYEIHESDEDDGKSLADLPPEAPTPPPAVDHDGNVNVFDFLVAATPTASTVNLQLHANSAEVGGGRQLVRFEHDTNDYVDPTGYMVDDEEAVDYETGTVPLNEFQTPIPKEHRKKKDGELKKDKKRKRLHIETSPVALGATAGDEVMTDAPPVLHSGLTGGLNRMMRPSQFPPSPDYSGGDTGEKSPSSPIKKTKHAKAAHTKSARPDTHGSNNLKAFMTGPSKSKVSKKRKHPTEKKEKKRRHSHHSSTEKVPKLIEYRSKSGDEKEGEGGQLIVYKPRSDLFLSLCNKGPTSERGCSVNKALKKFHRERSSSGTSLSKSVEEKELWRSLRMRRNERGEIVLFSLDDE